MLWQPRPFWNPVAPFRRPTTAAGAGIAFVVKDVAAAATDPSTSGVDTTGANLLVVVVSQYGAAADGTLSDSKSNTWTGLTKQDDGSLNYSQIYYCAGASVGGSHTFTYTGTGIFAVVSAMAFSGAHASPFDQQNGAIVGVDPTQPGSVTPSVDNSLIVTGVCANDTGFTVDSGFTLAHAVDTSGGVNLGLGSAYLIQGSAAAVNPSWTVAGNATIATFKPA